MNDIKNILDNKDVPFGIILENQIIDNGNIIRELEYFLKNLLTKDTDAHRTGFVFNTGSKCYDAALISLSLLYTVLNNEYSYTNL